MKKNGSYLFYAMLPAIVFGAMATEVMKDPKNVAPAVLVAFLHRFLRLFPPCAVQRLKLSKNGSIISLRTSRSSKLNWAKKFVSVRNYFFIFLKLFLQDLSGLSIKHTIVCFNQVYLGYLINLSDSIKNYVCVVKYLFWESFLISSKFHHVHDK